MKITDVKTMVIAGNFDWIIVKVETDEGITGIGESIGSSFCSEIVSYIHTLKKRIIGEDPLNIGRLTYLMGMGVSGFIPNAISGIEQALWDIMGKKLGVPVHTLLGGSHHDEVKIYADCHSGESVTSRESYGGVYEAYSPEAFAKNAKWNESLGYTLLKFDFYLPFPGPTGMIKTPLSNADIKHCVEVVSSIRNAIKPETGFALDMGGAYSIGEAIKIANAFEPFNLDWIEDPVTGYNVDVLANYTKSINVPVLCSYTQYRNTRQMCRDVIVNQAANLLAIDFGNQGGLQDGRKIADLAELYYIPIATHNIGSPVGTVAACQASATMPNHHSVEHHAIAVDWWGSLVNEDVVENGFYILNKRPGFGITLNEVAVTKHLKEGETFI